MRGPAEGRVLILVEVRSRGVRPANKRPASERCYKEADDTAIQESALLSKGNL